MSTSTRRTTRTATTRTATTRTATAARTPTPAPATVSSSAPKSSPKSSPKRPAHPISFAPGAGIPAAKVRGAVHCPECRDHPLPECACCGAPAVVAIADPDEKHAVTYCRDCLRVLVAARAECRGEKQINAARIAARRDAETRSSASPVPASSAASASPPIQTQIQTLITRYAGRAYPDVVQPALPLFAAMEVA